MIIQHLAIIFYWIMCSKVFNSVCVGVEGKKEKWLR